MGYLVIELARTIDEDRYLAAEDCRRISKALAVRQKQPANPIQSLARWLQCLARLERRAALEQQTRTLAGLG